MRDFSRSSRTFPFRFALAAIVCLLTLSPALHASVSGGIKLSTAGRHNFGVVADGDSVTYGIALTNQSSSVFDFSFSLTGASQFTYTTTCSAEIKPGKNCEIVFTYAPPAGDKSFKTATWTIANPGNVPFTPANTGSLQGSGAASGTLLLNTLKHNFLTEAVGGTTPQFGLVIQNSNSFDVNGTYDFEGDGEQFDFNSNCSAVIPAHSTCVILVDFDPLAPGQYSATLTINPSSGTVTPGNTITFIGTGTP